MNITNEELNALVNTTCEQEWNAVCDRIKAVRNGSYPPDWWPMVQMTGLMSRVMKSWVR